MNASTCLSVMLSPLKPLGGILPNLLHHFMVRMCESNIIFPHVRLSICPSSFDFSVTLSPPPYIRLLSVCLSIRLSLKQLGGILLFATSLSLMESVCESNIIFRWVRHGFICPSRYLLLNHWGESIRLATSLPFMV